MSDITLSEAEIERLSGGYKRAADQLRALHQMGFYRARRGKITGEVILTRAHVDSVEAGKVPVTEGELRNRPKLRAVK